MSAVARPGSATALPKPKAKAKAKIGPPKPPGDVDTMICGRGQYLQKTGADSVRHTADEDGKTFGPFAQVFWGIAEHISEDVQAHYMAPLLGDENKGNVCLLFFGEDSFKSEFFGDTHILLQKVAMGLKEEAAGGLKVQMVFCATTNELTDVLDGGAKLDAKEFDSATGAHKSATAMTISSLSNTQLKDFFATTYRKPDPLGSIFYYFKTPKRLVTVVDFCPEYSVGRQLATDQQASLTLVEAQYYLLFGEIREAQNIASNSAVAALKACMNVVLNKTQTTKTGVFYCVNGDDEHCNATLEHARCMVESRANPAGTAGAAFSLFADALNTELARMQNDLSTMIPDGDQRAGVFSEPQTGSRKSLLYEDSRAASAFSHTEGGQLLQKMRQLRDRPDMLSKLLTAPRCELFDGYQKSIMLEKEVQTRDTELNEALEHENELQEASHHMSEMLLAATDELEKTKKELVESQKANAKLQKDVAQMRTERAEIEQLLSTQNAEMRQLMKQAQQYMKNIYNTTH
ncbi:unnamed protein product [Amoebophrya sp. A120]|nr:unnamed protein product [Amoebophrya sp. A120]|eukprot:GSA120T00005805001.1